MTNDEIDEMAYFIKAALHDGPLGSRADIACALADRGVMVYKRYVAEGEELKERMSFLRKLLQA